MRKVSELRKEVRGEKDAHYEGKFKIKLNAAFTKRTNLITQERLAIKEVDRLTVEVAKATEEIVKLENTSETEIKEQIDEEDLEQSTHCNVWGSFPHRYGKNFFEEQMSKYLSND